MEHLCFEWLDGRGQFVVCRIWEVIPGIGWRGRGEVMGGRDGRQGGRIRLYSGTQHRLHRLILIQWIDTVATVATVVRMLTMQEWTCTGSNRVHRLIEQKRKNSLDVVPNIHLYHGKEQ